MEVGMSDNEVSLMNLTWASISAYRVLGRVADDAMAVRIAACLIYFSVPRFHQAVSTSLTSAARHKRRLFDIPIVRYSVSNVCSNNKNRSIDIQNSEATAE